MPVVSTQRPGRALLTAPLLTSPGTRLGAPGGGEGAGPPSSTLCLPRGQALSASLLLPSPAHLISHPPGPGMLYSSEGIASQLVTAPHPNFLLLCLSYKRKNYRVTAPQ